MAYLSQNDTDEHSTKTHNRFDSNLPSLMGKAPAARHPAKLQRVPRVSWLVDVIAATICLLILQPFLTSAVLGDQITQHERVGHNATVQKPAQDTHAAFFRALEAELGGEQVLEYRPLQFDEKTGIAAYLVQVGSEFGIARIKAPNSRDPKDLRAMVYWGSVKRLVNGAPVAVDQLALASTLKGTSILLGGSSDMELFLRRTCYRPVFGPIASFNIDFKPAKNFFRNFYLQREPKPTLAILDSERHLLIDSVSNIIVYRDQQFYSLMSYVNAMFASGEWRTGHESTRAPGGACQRDQVMAGKPGAGASTAADPKKRNWQ